MIMVLVYIVECLITKNYTSQPQNMGSNDSCNE